MEDDDEEFDEDVSEESEEEIVVKQSKSRKKSRKSDYEENYARSILGEEGMAVTTGAKDVAELLNMTALQRDQELARRSELRAQTLHKDELRQMLKKSKDAMNEDSEDDKNLVRRPSTRKRKKQVEEEEESEDSYLEEESDDLVEESDGENEMDSANNEWKGRLHDLLLSDEAKDDSPATAYDVSIVQLRRTYIIECMTEPWFSDWLECCFVKFPIGKLIDNPIYRIAKVERYFDGTKTYKLTDQISTTKLLEVSIGEERKIIKLLEVSNHKATQEEVDYYSANSVSVLTAATCQEYRAVHKKLLSRYAYSAKDVVEMVRQKQAQNNISTTLRGQIDALSTAIKQATENNDVRNEDARLKLAEKLKRLEKREERERKMLLSETHQMIQDINQGAIKYNQRAPIGNNIKKKKKDSTSRMEVKREAFWLTPDQIEAGSEVDGAKLNAKDVKGSATTGTMALNQQSSSDGRNFKALSPLSPNYHPFLHSAHAIVFSSVPANNNVPLVDRQGEYFRRIGLVKTNT